MRLVVSDIDGVLTDGGVCLSQDGREMKKICYRDLDAVGILKRADCKVAFITGESGKMAETLAGRFNVDYAVYGEKDKLKALEKLSMDTGVEMGNIIYIGDGDIDAPAIKAAGVGIAPRDATQKALESADIITKAPGGKGVLYEAAQLLTSKQ